LLDRVTVRAGDPERADDVAAPSPTSKLATGTGVAKRWTAIGAVRLASLGSARQRSAALGSDGAPDLRRVARDAARGRAIRDITGAVHAEIAECIVECVVAIAVAVRSSRGAEVVGPPAASSRTSFSSRLP